MKYETATVLLAFFGLAATIPLKGREVPQEHSHEQFLAAIRPFLNMNNPNQIVDPVFGLLGNAAAAGGKGLISDVTCLQQATADQAFTNAKAAGNVGGQVAALIYRALERNTPGVGVASAACTSLPASNPEIAAISQHQDPASPGAAAINKAIVLELAKQIKAVGGDPLDALKSGTFAAGNLSDLSGKGNTCDDQPDALGCIFQSTRLVNDATPTEISAAVAAVGRGAAPNPSATTTSCPTPMPTNVATRGIGSATSSGNGVPTPTRGVPTPTPTGPSGPNVQLFTGSLGGLPPAVIFTAGAPRPFTVAGTTDVNKPAAIQRSCDIQKNACADAANSGTLAGGVAQCETQHSACLVASP